MPKYRVLVDRVAVKTTTFIVEADSPEDAEHKGERLAYDFDFNTLPSNGEEYDFLVEEINQ